MGGLYVHAAEVGLQEYVMSGYLVIEVNQYFASVRDEEDFCEFAAFEAIWCDVEEDRAGGIDFSNVYFCSKCVQEDGV